MQPNLPLTFGPRYRTLTEIASGGMGAVYLALRLLPDGGRQPVAVKQLHAHLADDPDVVAAFVDEARIASRILHPNVVRVEDVEMVGHQLVIVMQYIEGVALSLVLKTMRSRGATLPVPVVRRILHDALLGLHAAHELRDESGVSLSVVHRDVSPHNCLIGADGVTRVTDFGIATAAGRVASTRTGGGVKGKLQYLSPEQIYRRPLDRRSDVFSAGAVLWECLTGRRLFSAGSEGETLAMVLREPIPPPSTHAPEVPFDLDETCLRALERDAERRFQSAEEFAIALANGPMASRDEVASLVRQAAPATIASRQSVLAQALRQTPAAALPADVDTGSSAAVAKSAPRPAPSRIPLIAALLVGVVAGGVGVGLAARRPATTPGPASPLLSSAPPQETSPLAMTSASSAAASPLDVDSVASASAEPPPPSAPPKPSASAAARPPPARPSKKTTGSGRPFMPSDL